MRMMWMAVLSLLIAVGLVLADSKSKKPAGKMATEEEVAAHLKVAETARGAPRINAVRWFSTVQPPNEKVKAEVALKLIEYMDDASTDPVTRGRCGEALPNWATEEIAAKLMPYLIRGGPDEHKGALIALGRLQYEKAIPELVRALDSLKDRSLAAQALIDMGPKAEDPVVKMLEAAAGKKR